MSDNVTLVEVGPRDGLQNEKGVIATSKKIELVDALSLCGLKRIEVTSFVSPKWVPQLADAADVMNGITRHKDVQYCVLTPNLKGMQSALKCKPDEIAIFTSASEGFCQKNINCSIQESLDRFEPVIKVAKDAEIPIRGYVSCITDCPYDGRVEPDQVAYVSGALFALGCREISLGDTLGLGAPDRIEAVLKSVLNLIPQEQLAGHYHNTNGRALENIKVSLDMGLRVFDSAVAGLGGCPYAPGAQGNVATEQVVEMLHLEGYETGVDFDALTTNAVTLAKSMRSE